MMCSTQYFSSAQFRLFLSIELVSEKFRDELVTQLRDILLDPVTAVGDMSERERERERATDKIAHY